MNVQSGASVTGTSNGLYLQSSSIFNSGAIVGTSNIGILSDSGLTVTNNAGASILGRIGINTSGFATVTNAGTITGTTLSAIGATAGLTLTNLAGGVITTGGFNRLLNFSTADMPERI